VQVSLTVANLSIGITNTTLTIPVNSSQVQGVFLAGSLAGNTTIFAVTDDFQSGVGEVSVLGEAPARLMLTALPGTIRADPGASALILITLLDESGFPVRAQDQIVIHLALSNASLGELEPRVALSPGQYMVETSLTLSGLPGEVVISTFARGLRPAQLALRIEEVPGALVLHTARGPIPAEVGDYPALALQLVDPAGGLIKATTPVQVKLLISNPDLVYVKPWVIIPVGGNYAPVQVRSLTKPGDVRIHTESELYEGVEAQLTLANYPLENRLVAERKLVYVFDQVRLLVQAVSRGLPVAGAEVSWSTTLGRFTATDSLTNAQGLAGGILELTEAGSAKIRVTVSKPGYFKAHAFLTINATLRPLNITLLPPETSMKAGDVAELTVVAVSDDERVGEVLLNWSVNMSSLARAANMTDDQGLAQAIFFSNMPGTAIISVVAKKPGYTSANATAKVVVQPLVEPEQPAEQPPPETQPFTIFGLSLNMILAVVGVVVALLAFVIIRRRLRARRLREEEAVEEELV
jgi:hypothetical protein